MRRSDLAPRRPSAARGYSDDSLGCRSVVSGDSDNVCGGERYGKLDVRAGSVADKTASDAGDRLSCPPLDVWSSKWLCPSFPVPLASPSCRAQTRKDWFMINFQSREKCNSIVSSLDQSGVERFICFFVLPHSHIVSDLTIFHRIHFECRTYFASIKFICCNVSFKWNSTSVWARLIFISSPFRYMRLIVTLIRYSVGKIQDMPCSSAQALRRHAFFGRRSCTPS